MIIPLVVEYNLESVSTSVNVRLSSCFSALLLWMSSSLFFYYCGSGNIGHWLAPAGLGLPKRVRHRQKITTLPLLFKLSLIVFCALKELCVKMTIFDHGGKKTFDFWTKSKLLIINRKFNAKAKWRLAVNCLEIYFLILSLKKFDILLVQYLSIRQTIQRPINNQLYKLKLIFKIFYRFHFL